MIMAEMKKPRETFVLGRGQYDNPKDKVTAGVPAFLPPMAPGLPMNRLGLAKWIVDPANPLAARVAVNHFWQEYFGTGIVKTSEDFGSQGEQPSNPLLLDWLATEFARTGWNVKAMQRLIVTSATYRQSSRVTPGTRGTRPGESPAGARPAIPPAGGVDPRQCPRRQRPARRSHRRSQRLTPISPRACGKRWRFGPDSPGRPTRSRPAGTSTGAACTPFGNAPCRPRRWSPSTRLTGKVHGAPFRHQHAAPGAGAH
jgi:hypothetical protein